jgi:hypothetical protein
MKTYSLSAVTLEGLLDLCDLTGSGVSVEPWATFLRAPVSEEDAAHVRDIVARLYPGLVMALNESTLWSRAIYPMLMQAEVGRVRAYAQVPLDATLPGGARLAGVVDGVLAPESPLGGAPAQPFLVTVETKRGIESGDPRPQLLAAMLAAGCLRESSGTGWMTRELPARAPERRVTVVEGCYTVGDVWTFVEATISWDHRVVDGRSWHRMDLAYSRELSERTDALDIFRVLRGIVLRGIEEAASDALSAG